MTRKHLVFDMDGTLVHSDSIYSTMVAGFEAETGICCDFEKIVQGYMNPLTIDMGWGIPLEEQPLMYNRMKNYHIEQMRDHKNFLPDLYPGLEVIIPELAEQYDLSLITLNTHAIAQEFLEHHNLNRYFPHRRTLCCAQERSYGVKPSPDALHCILKERGLGLSDSVMIGDSRLDIEMAHAAGIKSIAVLWGLASTEKVMAANPTIAIDKTIDLPQAIEKVFSL